MQDVILAKSLWVLAIVGTAFFIYSHLAWAETPRIWVTHSLEKVFPETEKPQNAKTSIELKLGRNDTEDAQIIVRMPKGVSAGGARFTPSDLTGPKGATLSKDCISAWWVWYTYVLNNPNGNTDPKTYLRKAPAFFPDAFLEQKEIRIRDQWTQPLWVSVHVPKGAKPGTYTGTFAVDMTVGGEPMHFDIPVTVTVWPFTLPDEFHLHHTEWFTFWSLADYYRIPVWSEEFWVWVERVAVDMARHKQDMILTPLASLVRIKQTAPNEFSFDFSNLDRWVETFKKAGVTWIEGSHVAGRGAGWEGPFVWNRFAVEGVDTAALSEEAFEPYVEALLKAVHAHLKERGWAERYVQHIADEPVKANESSWTYRAVKVREWMPGVPIIDAVMLDGLKGYIDIRVPQIQEITPEFERVPGESLWSYVCLSPKGIYPNRFVDYPLIRNRILFWLSWSMRLEGFLHWGYNYWQTWPEVPVAVDVSPWLDATGASIYVQDRSPLPAGDPFIVYPGRNSICSSMRWEDVRNGMEDFEYLYLLEQAITKSHSRLSRSVQQEAQRLLARVRDELAPSPVRHTHDAELLLSIREQAGELLARIAKTTGVNR
ncbi:MAG TPA: DUF4091 domain-containing protein [Candidatus Hydrogenedentes bacterium]|nr:DUF4091 domain-containing protein [Candidatus Hydrogenedentota bacterium]HOL77071.1 DUF4091 domain-containing protein [Candidatus Hydrogenedentota bacterium]HPO87139.1 DUF4091 domain-containing protein [Candidatus Hydrogenedentota bacterium]